MSGPLWTGPLHDGDYIGQMLELAWEMGWTDLESLLKRMQEESDPRLTFGYIKIDEVCSVFSLTIIKLLSSTFTSDY